MDNCDVWPLNPEVLSRSPTEKCEVVSLGSFQRPVCLFQQNQSDAASRGHLTDQEKELQAKETKIREVEAKLERMKPDEVQT